MTPPLTSGVLERLRFVHQPTTRIICGLGAVDDTGQITREFSKGSVLLVTDPGLVAAGHAQRVIDSLGACGLAVEVFASVQENPTTACVEACRKQAVACRIDTFVALGGGSAMDTAKGCNFLLTNGGEMKDYWGVGKATRPMLPLIAIPTTAGTGSEMQSAALIADAVTHQKMACLDPKAAARVAILDPALTVSQPPQVTACTGIDAIAHAVESMVTRKRNAISMMYAREAFRLGVAAFPAVLRSPTNLEARAQMLLAAALAGTAIENSMLGAAHAAANPLTAHYGVPHGEAVGLMLPHIVRFNVRDTTARQGYAELAGMVDTPPGRALSGTGDESLVSVIEHLLNLAGMHRSIAEVGAKASDVPMLGAEAMKQWTAQFNPRDVTEVDFIDLYAAALKPRLTGL